MLGIAPRYNTLVRAFLRSIYAMDLDPYDAVLVGSAPLAEFGLRDVDDLDVLVSPAMMRLMQERRARIVSGWMYSINGAGEHAGYGAELELYSVSEWYKIQINSENPFLSASGVDAKTIFSRAVSSRFFNVYDIRVLDLISMVQIKRASKRAKDAADLLLLSKDYRKALCRESTPEGD